MTENDVDTVTPLDTPGEGFDQEVATASTNVEEEDYHTQGRTTVATPSGYRFTPSDTTIPVVHSNGVKVTKDQASALADESDGLVFVVGEDD